MENLGYYNGHTDIIENIKIPITDRVCWFGDGIYEASLAGRKIFALDEHLNRLFASAKGIDIEPPHSKKEFEVLLNDLTKKVKGDLKLVYWQVTRDGGLRNHAYDETLKANLLITIRKIDMPDKDIPLSLITLEDKRYKMCNIKTLNLLPNVLAMQIAKNAKCGEAVFVGNGFVRECSHSNIHIIKDGIFKTHPADSRILAGIARAHLIKHCQTLGIPVEFNAFTLGQLYQADEVIVTSSSQICLRANFVDGNAVGGRASKIFENLQMLAYSEFYEGIK
ncbi:MAG: aminotransferase class IV [Elusimicrobiota bacterium]|jgi:D-alanine transaminase|nr:aminotransferase class IV [Elusimicrobiota bacterium]